MFAHWPRPAGHAVPGADANVGGNMAINLDLACVPRGLVIVSAASKPPAAHNAPDMPNDVLMFARAGAQHRHG